ncbi:unnamed protein product [Citrullus colocynthis]|uniref:Uncharacterized protein n=1 Tax=Citrullus colocynthis TaxID=252529 RepID=A0ABP0XV35_9ROSI
MEQMQQIINEQIARIEEEIKKVDEQVRQLMSENSKRRKDLQALQGLLSKEAETSNEMQKTEELKVEDKKMKQVVFDEEERKIKYVYVIFNGPNAVLPVMKTEAFAQS